MAVKRGYAQVSFNEDAYAEDILRCGRTVRPCCARMRSRNESESVAIAELRRCEGEGNDGTRLPGCFKVYLSAPNGKFGMVLRFTIPTKGLGAASRRYGPLP